MDSVGLMPPPPGVVAHLDYNGPSSSMLALQVTAIVISVLFVSTRIYARAFMLRAFGWDDAWLLAALATSIFYFVAFIQASRYGLARHLWDIPMSKAKPFNMWLSIVEITYSIPSLFLRTSIFLSLARVFNAKSMRYLCWAGMLFCVVCYAVVFFGSLLNCRPVIATFDITVQGRCGTHTGRLAELSGFVSGFSDLYITLLPMPYIWKLQMPIRKKLSVGAVFGLGIFCAANSFARTALTFTSVETADPSFTLWKLAILATLELVIGFVAASCLVAPAFIRTVAKPWADSAVTLVKNVWSSGKASRSSESKIHVTAFDSRTGSSEVSYQPERKEARTYEQPRASDNDMSIIRTDEARIDVISRV